MNKKSNKNNLRLRFGAILAAALLALQAPFSGGVSAFAEDFGGANENASAYTYGYSEGVLGDANTAGTVITPGGGKKPGLLAPDGLLPNLDAEADGKATLGESATIGLSARKPLGLTLDPVIGIDLFPWFAGVPQTAQDQPPLAGLAVEVTKLNGSALPDPVPLDLGGDIMLTYRFDIRNDTSINILKDDVYMFRLPTQIAVAEDAIGKPIDMKAIYGVGGGDYGVVAKLYPRKYTDASDPSQDFYYVEMEFIESYVEVAYFQLGSAFLLNASKITPGQSNDFEFDLNGDGTPEEKISHNFGYPTPDVKVEKTHTAYVEATNTIEWTLTVEAKTKEGYFPIENLTIVDTMDEYLIYDENASPISGVFEIKSDETVSGSLDTNVEAAPTEGTYGFTDVTGSTGTGNGWQTLTYTFTDPVNNPAAGGQNGRKYTITYKTTVDPDVFSGGKANNNGKISKLTADLNNSLKATYTAGYDQNGDPITKETQPVTDKETLSRDMLEKSGESQWKGEKDSAAICWTVKFNHAGMALPSGQTLVDTLDAGLTFVASDITQGSYTFPAPKLYPKGSNTEISSGVTASANGQTITFTLDTTAISNANLSDTDYPLELKYYTTYDGDKTFGEDGVTYKNSVSLTLANGEKLTQGYGVGVASSLLKKTGEYKAGDRKVDWTIVINENEVKGFLASNTLVEKIPSNQTLDVNSVTVDGAKVSPISKGSADGSNIYEIDISSVTQKLKDGDKVEVKLITELLAGLNNSNNDIVGQNGSTDLLNVVTLKYDSNGQTPTEAEKQGKAPASSTVIEKAKGSAYKQGLRHANWKITVNKNKMEINNAVVRDTLENGMTLVDGVAGSPIMVKSGSTTLVRDTDYSVSTETVGSKQVIVFKFLKKITAQCTIEYWTLVPDSAFDNQNNNNIKIENTAVLEGDEITKVPGKNSAHAEQNVGKPNLAKTASVGSGIVTWTVMINQNQMTLKKPSDGLMRLTDKLHEDLALDMESILLYKINKVESGEVGTGSPNELVPYSSGKYKVQYSDPADGGDNTFTLSFTDEQIENAYKLIFKTGATKQGNGQKFANTISMKFDGGGGDEEISNNVTSGSMNVSADQAGGAGFTGKVQPTKVDDKGNPLAGAKFEVKNTSDIVLTTLTTGVDGKPATAYTLRKGDYTLIETVAPAGYVLDSTPLKFKVVYKSGAASGQVVDIAPIVNKAIMATEIEIEKKAESGELITSSPATFKIEKKAADGSFSPYNPPNDTADTGTTGKAKFINLTEGDYRITETKAPDGYELDSTPKAFSVTAADHDKALTPITVTNKAKSGSIEILKKNEDGTKPLSGAEFAVYNAANTEVRKATTGADGKAIIPTSGTPALTPGEYYFKETKAPLGYKLPTDGAKTAFTILPGPAVLWKNAGDNEVRDEPALGSVKFIKKDMETGKLLSGAEIAIYLGDVLVDGPKATNDKGEVLFSNLLVGPEYTYKETKAPEGYLLPDAKYPITLKDEGKTLEVVVRNRPVKAGLTLVKVDSETGVALLGAEFTLYAEDKTTIIGKSGTGLDGIVQFPELRVGSYYYKETGAPDGYILSDKFYPITVKSTGEAVNETVKNTPKTGSFELLKTDNAASPAPLSGAVIAVYEKGGAEPLIKITTGLDGRAVFTGLRLGEYFYKELEAPRGYILDSTEHAFTVSEHGEVVKATLSNKPVPPPPPSPPSSSGGGDDGWDPGNPPPNLKPKEPGVTPKPSTTGNNVPPGFTPPSVPPSELHPAPPEPPVTYTPQEPAKGQVEIPPKGEAKVTTPPGHGGVTMMPDGKWQYTPEDGFTGQDEFTVTITDKDGNYKSVRIVINVTEALFSQAKQNPTTDDGSLHLIYIVQLLLLSLVGMWLAIGKGRKGYNS